MLYIVATPIGNMAEITYRAVEVLKNVDVIAAEDTRHSGLLLKYYGIEKRMISYQKFNERQCAETLVELLKSGKDVALISDAGMPLVSDPGCVLVSRLIEEGLDYTVVSGACACINALILSGLDTSGFCMAGFLPEKNIDRERFIARFAALQSTLLFYSPPHNVLKDLAFLYESLGSRRAAVVREISKMFESVTRGRLGEMPEFTVKGEFVIAVEGADPAASYEGLTVAEQLRGLIAGGMDKKDAVKEVARLRGIAKSLVYAEALRLDE